MYQFERAEGIYLYDSEGKAYIDLISGIAVNNIGHSHPKVVEAVKNQAEKYMHQMVYGEYLIGPQIKLAEKLKQLTPPQFESFYFTNSGSEAIEGALKLARKYTGRAKNVAMKNAYHGSTSGALSLMSNSYYSGAFKPLLPDIHFAELNNVASLELIDENTAAVFIECIQAESGYTEAQPEFISALNKKAKEFACLIIADEVQSGIKRSGPMWSFTESGLNADILVSAKGLGGGMPIGCFSASKEIMSSIQNEPILGHITTFGGHPVSCAASLACLEVVEEISTEDIQTKSSLFRELLQHKNIYNISGRGLMLAIHLKDFDTVEKVIEMCFKQGLIIDWFLYSNNALRISPPLVITEDEIRKICEIILEALDRV
ncbi:aspartate aminotransferase family protein [bacterium]|nr:aspartate aminotransferase family protein [bacterium]